MRESEVRALRGLRNISWLTTRQLKRLANELTMSVIERRDLIFDDRHSPDSAYVLLSGVARFTCRNRGGGRTMVIMVAPGMIPGFPPIVPGIRYDFRCEAVTKCEIGTLPFATLIEIALGIAPADFKRMAAIYSAPWERVQLRCSNFMSCTLEERLALILVELSENFGVRNGQKVRITVPASHKDLAELVGASRPRVTEYLASFERKQMIARDGRQLIVRCDRLESFLKESPSSSDCGELGDSISP